MIAWPRRFVNPKARGVPLREQGHPLRNKRRNIIQSMVTVPESAAHRLQQQGQVVEDDPYDIDDRDLPIEDNIFPARPRQVERGPHSGFQSAAQYDPDKAHVQQQAGPSSFKSLKPKNSKIHSHPNDRSYQPFATTKSQQQSRPGTVPGTVVRSSIQPMNLFTDSRDHQMHRTGHTTQSDSVQTNANRQAQRKFRHHQD